METGRASRTLSPSEHRKRQPESVPVRRVPGEGISGWARPARSLDRAAIGTLQRIAGNAATCAFLGSNVQREVAHPEEARDPIFRTAPPRERRRPPFSIGPGRTMRPDPTQIGSILFSPGETPASAYYLIFGAPTEAEKPTIDVLAPDEATRRKDGTYQRFRLASQTAEVFAGMDPDLSAALFAQAIHGVAVPLVTRRPFIERVAKYDWVPPAIFAEIARLNEEGEFSRGLPWVREYPSPDPRFGPIVVWVGKEFAGSPQFEAFQGKPIDYDWYLRAHHGNEHAARLDWKTSLEKNDIIRRLIIEDERHLSPEVAQRVYEEMMAKEFQMKLGALGEVYGSMGGFGGPPPVVGPRYRGGRPPRGGRAGRGTAPEPGVETGGGGTPEPIGAGTARATRGAGAAAAEITAEVVERRYGIPLENLRGFQDVADRYNVVIDVRPTTPEAPGLLRAGALPKEEWLKAKTINKYDSYLGTAPEDIGKVGFFEPKLPDRRPEGMDADTWTKVQDRHRRRLEEWTELRADMDRYATSKGISIRDKVVISKEGKAFTGDHDIYRILFADGSLVPKELQDEIVDALRPFGVSHGPHVDWTARNVAEAVIDLLIVIEHGPGGTALLRIGPGKKLSTATSI